MLLLTRSMADSIKSKSSLTRLGFDSFIEPMFRVHYFPTQIVGLSDCDIVIVTSRHGITGVSRVTSERNMRIVTVGDSTMEHAVNLGFKNVETVSGTVKDLLKYLGAKAPGLNVLYVRGANVSHNLSGSASDLGVTVREVILYRTVACTAFSTECSDLLTQGKISGVLFYSKGTAEIFIGLAKDKCNAILRNISAYTMSKRAGEVLRACTWKGVFVTQHPTEVSLFELLLGLEKNTTVR